MGARRALQGCWKASLKHAIPSGCWQGLHVCCQGPVSHGRKFVWLSMSCKKPRQADHGVPTMSVASVAGGQEKCAQLLLTCNLGQFGQDSGRTTGNSVHTRSFGWGMAQQLS